MPSSAAIFDLASHWHPVAHSLASLHGEVGQLADSADSVLGEVELIRQELVSRAIELEQLQSQLAQREGHLAQQRTEHTRLCSQFEQQEARLTDTMEELRRLREELASRATPSSLAADSARLALEQAGEVWKHDRAELMERLNALVMMQQTGSGDAESVKAFCHELTEIHDLITSSHEQTRQAIDKETRELRERLASLVEASAQGSASAAPLEELRTSLGELREALAKLQSQSIAAVASQKDELLKRLDSLAIANPESPQDSRLLESIQNELSEMRKLVASVQSSPAALSESESLISELRSELGEMRRIAEQTMQSASQASQGQEAIAALRAEMEALRQMADEARQQTTRQETERALVEAELDRLRTQAAQWRRELEEETARHHDEERLWREELQEMRHLVRQAAMTPAESSSHSALVGVAQNTGEREAESSCDPVANSLMAQFAKLQKDSARRRNRGNNP